MKNTDMKVIAIILTVALCLTVLTSNVVSIASVVILAKGSTGATVEAGTNAGTNTDVNAPAGNAGTQTQTPAGNSGNTAATQAPSGNTGATQPSGNTGATQAPAGNNGGATASNKLSSEEALAMYQKAAKDIHDNGTAGYTKKGWQAVEGDLQLTKLNFLAGPLTSLVKGFMTEESAAEEKINEKGSDDAKNRMPISNCAASDVASATGEKLADGNYKIVIVMKDQVNPSYSDTSGLVLMSREFLDFKDVQNTVATDETVKKLVKSLDGTITYKAYTITATMTADGKFVDITHYCVADIVADVEAVAGSLGASGALSFNAKYYDFKY